MKRMTVTLSDDLYRLLCLEAERRRTTISAVTRAALEEHLALRRRQLGAAGAGRSGRADVSERIEEIPRNEVGR